MITVPLLAALTVVPGLALFDPIDLRIGDGFVAYDRIAGKGEPVTPGQRVSIDFDLTDGLGRSLANSAIRGLPYAYEMGGAFQEPLLESALEGVMAGTERTAWFPADYLPSGLGSLAPPHTELVLHVTVRSIDR